MPSRRFREAEARETLLRVESNPAKPPGTIRSSQGEARLRGLCCGQRRVLQNSVENPASRQTNIVQTLEQKFRVSPVQLDVVGGGHARFESDGLADDISYGLGFGLPDRLRRGGPPRLVMQEFVRQFVREHGGMFGGARSGSKVVFPPSEMPRAG